MKKKSFFQLIRVNDIEDSMKITILFLCVSVVSAMLPQEGVRLQIPTGPSVPVVSAVQSNMGMPSSVQSNMGMPSAIQSMNPSNMMQSMTNMQGKEINAVAKQEVLQSGSLRIDLTPNHLRYIVGGTVRAFKHRTLIYNVLTGQWSEIDGQKVILDVIEFEIHLWIAKHVSEYLSKNLPIQGMGNIFIQLSYMTFAENYLTRQRLKGMISMIDETKVSFADEVAKNFDFLGQIVVAKLVTQVNLKEVGQTTTFVLNKEVQNAEIVTAFIFRIEGNVVYKVAIYNCRPKHVFVYERKTHLLLELANETCKRSSDDVIYMMNL